MVTLLWRPNSEHATKVAKFERFLKQRYPEFELEKVDVDSKQGAHLVELYNLPQYPAIVVTDERGHPLQSWQGKLPTVSDLTYWASQ